MKIKIFTLLFGLLFLFIGASPIKAESPSSSGNSVKLPENTRVSEIRLKIAATLKIKCTAAFADCDQLLSNLRTKNAAWEACVQNGGSCSTQEAELIAAGDSYNNAGCVPENAIYIHREKTALVKNNNG